LPACDRLSGATFFVGQRGSIHEKFSCLIIETAPDNLDYRIWLFLGFLFFRVDFGISTFPSVNWLYISWFPPFLFLVTTGVGATCLFRLSYLVPKEQLSWLTQYAEQPLRVLQL
jgi:hypothetical protein